ncbi:MAG: metallophosphoesterase [Pseudomonadales bacterium]|nr:metallophosphoesterase [Pseudomonadales bacterium]
MANGIMRVHAISDIHVDYPDNLAWLRMLSSVDYRDDILILAGDVSEDMDLLAETFLLLLGKFRRLCFIPGNHELWVRNSDHHCSLEKFAAVRSLCRSLGVEIDLYREAGLSVVPLHGWYDYSFASPDRHLRRGWRDYQACAWPQELDSSAKINQHFLARNTGLLCESNKTVISYSHFVPSIELMPQSIPDRKRILYPVLGSTGLGEQVTQLKPDIHIYGHSHVNQSRIVEGIRYVNNAFGYPSETRIAGKQLLCVFQGCAE